MGVVDSGGGGLGTVKELKGVIAGPEPESLGCVKEAPWFPWFMKRVAPIAPKAADSTATATRRELDLALHFCGI